MLERIAARRAELAEHVEHLGKELAETRAELERVTAAEQVVAQLIAEDERQPAQAAPAGLSAASRRIPQRRDVDGASALPASYRMLWEAVMAADGPVSCADVCRAAGVGGEKNQVEGARSKLRKLAERGWLRVNGAGMFQRS